MFNLIEWSEAQGRTEKLIQGACTQNPGNTELQKFVQEREVGLFHPGRQRATEQQVPSSSKLLHIFLCHANEDKPAVRKLYNWLRANGFNPWFDEESLLPGQEWKYEISKAVRESDIFLVCLSQQSVRKTGYLNKEIVTALDIAEEQPEGTIFIIPVRLEECPVPDRLNRWHWVNLYEERGYERLLRALERVAGNVSSATFMMSEELLTPAFPRMVKSAEQRLQRLSYHSLSPAKQAKKQALEQQIEGLKRQYEAENQRLLTVPQPGADAELIKTRIEQILQEMQKVEDELNTLQQQP